MSEYGKKLDRFVEVVRELRSEEGCPWDRQQSPESLQRYLHEETREAIEAINEGDHHHTRDELGDILYLIVLLARIYEEKGSFNIGDVIEAITEKMIRRHPHVFSDEEIGSISDLKSRWREIKDREKFSDNNPEKN